MAKTPPQEEIRNLMDRLKISVEEAVELWNCDHEQEQNEEQNALDEKAKKVKISKECGNRLKGAHKVVSKKVSPEKIEIFNKILNAIKGATAEKENQSIAVSVGNKNFTINIIEHRPPK